MVLVLTFGVVLFVTVALSVAMDVTWTAEFAESGWIRPFPEDVARRVESGTLRAAYGTGTYQDQLWRRR